MSEVKRSNEQHYYDVLKRIAKDYMTPAQIERDAAKSFGALSAREYLEMAYENIQEDAKRAIKGKRRPA